MKICSCIMGSGKTQGCIQMLNNNPAKKYIYVTPYTDETERIQNECPELRFVIPGNFARHNYKKIKHIEALIADGRNVSTTHASFRSFTKKMLESIKEYDYTLIIDEAIDIMQKSKYSKFDIEMLIRANMVELDRDTMTYKYIGDESFTEGEGYFPEICRIALSNNLYLCSDEGADKKRKDAWYYFMLPMDFIKAFRETYVLTYLFEGSELCAMCKAFGIDYEYIGIEKIDYGTGYLLSETGTYVPEYVKTLKDKIVVYEDVDDEPTLERGRPKKKLNTYTIKTGKIPEEKDFKLSHSFYNKNKNSDLVSALRCNQKTFFDRMIKDHGGTRTLCQWSVYKNVRDKTKSKGLQSRFVSLNTSATNKFADRCYLSYLCDLYVPPEKKRYYEQFGIEYDQDTYALSTMIQWIWRSRIRNGETIYVYVPAKRMRDLLEEWIDKVSA